MNTNRVYYGEYTLSHWVDLLLHKRIILPPYQRSFVWDKSKVQHLFESINNDYFIPPVTIGHLRKDERDINMIIDGQQRLTSILLGCLQMYPKKDYFKEKDVVEFANDNDDQYDDEQSVLGWTFESLLENDNNSVESIRKRLLLIDDSKYESLPLDITISKDFLDSHYLGFSYLLPLEAESQKFFSNTFKSINTLGTALSALESRRSLYFLSDGMEEFFDPKWCRTITIYNGFKADRIDFVRYLSFAFQLIKTHSCDGIAKYYGRQLEDYYSEFIISVVNKQPSETFETCNDSNVSRINEVKKEISQMGLSTQKFPSIIDADIFLFGLIYYVVAEERDIDTTRNGELTSKLNKKIEEYKADSYHKKNPAALKYLRKRLGESKSIYEQFIK